MSAPRSMHHHAACQSRVMHHEPRTMMTSCCPMTHAQSSYLLICACIPGAPWPQWLHAPVQVIQLSIHMLLTFFWWIKPWCIVCEGAVISGVWHRKFKWGRCATLWRFRRNPAHERLLLKECSMYLPIMLEADGQKKSKTTFCFTHNNALDNICTDSHQAYHQGSNHK